MSGSIAILAFMALLAVALLPAASEAQTAAAANFGIVNQWALITVDNSAAPNLGKVTSGTPGCVEFDDSEIPKCVTHSIIKCPVNPANPGADNDVCAASFRTGTKVTLTAAPVVGALSCVQWTLPDGTTQLWSKTVSVPVVEDTSLSVGFYAAGEKGTVSVSVTDPADTPVSWVNSSPPGIRQCGLGLDNSVCDADFNYCTKITLTAHAATAKGEFFAGWGDGVCAGSTTNTCSFTLYPDVSSLAKLTKKTTKVSVKPGPVKSRIEAVPEGNQ
jgi:hypothetical protein